MGDAEEIWNGDGAAIGEFGTTDDKPTGIEAWHTEEVGAEEDAEAADDVGDWGEAEVKEDIPSELEESDEEVVEPKPEEPEEPEELTEKEKKFFARMEILYGPKSIMIAALKESIKEDDEIKLILSEDEDTLPYLKAWNRKFMKKNPKNMRETSGNAPKPEMNKRYRDLLLLLVARGIAETIPEKRTPEGYLVCNIGTVDEYLELQKELAAVPASLMVFFESFPGLFKISEDRLRVKLVWDAEIPLPQQDQVLGVTAGGKKIVNPEVVADYMVLHTAASTKAIENNDPAFEIEGGNWDSGKFVTGKRDLSESTMEKLNSSLDGPPKKKMKLTPKNPSIVSKAGGVKPVASPASDYKSKGKDAKGKGKKGKEAGGGKKGYGADRYPATTKGYGTDKSYKKGYDNKGSANQKGGVIAPPTTAYGPVYGSHYAGPKGAAPYEVPQKGKYGTPPYSAPYYAPGSYAAASAAYGHPPAYGAPPAPGYGHPPAAGSPVYPDTAGGKKGELPAGAPIQAPKGAKKGAEKGTKKGEKGAERGSTLHPPTSKDVTAKGKKDGKGLSPTLPQASLAAEGGKDATGKDGYAGNNATYHDPYQTDVKGKDARGKATKGKGKDAKGGLLFKGGDSNPNNTPIAAVQQGGKPESASRHDSQYGALPGGKLHYEPPHSAQPAGKDKGAKGKGKDRKDGKGKEGNDGKASAKDGQKAAKGKDGKAAPPTTHYAQQGVSKSSHRAPQHGQPAHQRAAPDHQQPAHQQHYSAASAQPTESSYRPQAQETWTVTTDANGNQTWQQITSAPQYAPPPAHVAPPTHHSAPPTHHHAPATAHQSAPPAQHTTSYATSSSAPEYTHYVVTNADGSTSSYYTQTTPAPTSYTTSAPAHASPAHGAPATTQHSTYYSQTAHGAPATTSYPSSSPPATSSTQYVTYQSGGPGAPATASYYTPAPAESARQFSSAVSSHSEENWGGGWGG